MQRFTPVKGKSDSDRALLAERNLLLVELKALEQRVPANRRIDAVELFGEGKEIVLEMIKRCDWKMMGSFKCHKL